MNPTAQQTLQSIKAIIGQLKQAEANNSAMSSALSSSEAANVSMLNGGTMDANLLAQKENQAANQLQQFAQTENNAVQQLSQLEQLLTQLESQV